MIELNKSDWEDAKRQAEQMVKNALIVQKVNQNLFNIANKEIAKFPNDKTQINGEKSLKPT